MVCPLAICQTNFVLSLLSITDRQDTWDNLQIPSCTIAAIQCAIYYWSVKIWNNLNQALKQNLLPLLLIKRLFSRREINLFFCSIFR